MPKNILMNKLLTVLAAAVLVLGLAVQPASAQQSRALDAEVDELKDDMQGLKQSQDRMLKMLEGIERRLQARPAAPRRRGPPPFTGADIAIDGAPFKGAAKATIAIVEFSDYQCPFCRRYAANTLPQVIKDYVDAGKLRYVFRDFPIARIHPAATGAAVAARCAGAQGKYWEMHDRFFANQPALKQRKWKDHATALGLDTDAFDQCMIDKDMEQAVKRDIADGRKVGVTGTPAFYFGTVSADGKTLKATEMIRGARPYGSFKEVIDRLLAKHAG